MTITLCMIVKDEACDLPGCVESVREIVDEIVVMDTGSKDGTQEMAKKLGAKVYEMEWVNDFSAARNASLENVRSDRVLMLDADERLSAKDHRRILDLIQNEGVDGFYFIQRHYLPGAGYDNWIAVNGEYPEMEKDYTGYTQNLVLRLFKKAAGIKWEGRIHETVVCVEPQTRWITAKTDIVVHHYGKVGDNEKLREKKLRYLKLSRLKAEDHPLDAKVWFELGMQMHELGQWEECAAPFKRAFELDENFADALYYIGNARFKTGMFAQAREALAKLVSIDPTHTDALVSLAGVERAEENHEAALGLFDRAIALDNNHFGAWFNKAALLLNLSRYLDAKPCFNNVLSLMPDYYPAAFGRWQVDIHLGESERAPEEMLIWLERKPEIKTLLMQAFDIFSKQGKLDLIERAFAPLADKLNEAKVYAMLGAAALAGKRVDAAEAYLVKAVDMDGRLNDARVNLAQLKEVYRRDIAAAVALYEQSLRADPENRFIKGRLAALKNN